MVNRRNAAEIRSVEGKMQETEKEKEKEKERRVSTFAGVHADSC